MATKATLLDLAAQRILLLDGAMGSMLQHHKLDETAFRGDRFADWTQPVQGNNDLLNLTQPDIIRSIHEAYIEAGADIIETNTFNAQAISMADYGMESLVYEINYEGAKLAKEAAAKFSTSERPRFVAGAMGPTNRTLSMSPDVNQPGYRNTTFQELVDAYTEQARGLLDGGADILLVETIFDTLNAKAALYAIDEVLAARDERSAIMVSGTITDASGRTLSGQTAEAFWVSLSHVDMLSIGLNCALGAKDLLPHLQVLSQQADCLISAYPNAGLPNAFGGYDETPEAMAGDIGTYLDLGLVNIVGGCCGTTPDHIRAFAAQAEHATPRAIPTTS